MDPAPPVISRLYQAGPATLCDVCVNAFEKRPWKYSTVWPDLVFDDYRHEYVHSFLLGRRCQFERFLDRLLTVEPGLEPRKDSQVQVLKSHKDGDFVVYVKLGHHVKAVIYLQDLIIPGTHLAPPVLMGSTPLQPSLVRGWMKECEKSHIVSCTISPSSLAFRIIKIFVIDVERLCVCEIISSQRYCALSYVVGGRTGLQLTKENRSKLFQEKSLSPETILTTSSRKVPKVIRDGMLLVKSLGERYLWADSLCITQDDEGTKQTHIMNMDVIYSQALLTIISVSGKDSSCSLPGIRPNTRPDLNLTIDLGGFKMLAQPPGLRNILADSPYETRGWTFQERTLSPRCLYLTNWQAFFQCRGSFHAEHCSERHADEVAAYSSADHRAEQINELRNENKGFDKETTVHQEPPGIMAQKPLMHGLDIINPFIERVDNDDFKFYWAYSTLVESYTSRNLTFPSDILNAFAGITSAMERQYDTHFVSGMPLRELSKALLWAPLGRSELRDPAVLDRAANNTYVNLPTWSWAAWEGRCGYVLNGTAEGYSSDDLKPIQGRDLITTTTFVHRVVETTITGAHSVLTFEAQTFPISQFFYELYEGTFRHHHFQAPSNHYLWVIRELGGTCYQCGVLFLSPSVPVGWDEDHLYCSSHATQEISLPNRKLVRICTFAAASNFVDLRRFRDPNIPTENEIVAFYDPYCQEFLPDEVGDRYIAALFVEERVWATGTNK
ncbi:heterokaryon incompatibility protein-domain-containing protein [Podospora didyma]|uniref:Heterokaryon incompatibility protein-domain-containing protein n=1 Tax=Podospora didyma TaxID=330526 RepID=A0AAE0P542_9PEZI|nr:heterokaryon incompatibility protein-domain-containing protein [Podospora didyma]